nr:hypothetical protein [Sphaerisporangium fuscum]
MREAAAIAVPSSVPTQVTINVSQHTALVSCGGLAPTVRSSRISSARSPIVMAVALSTEMTLDHC